MKEMKKGFDPYALACLIIIFVPLLFVGAAYLISDIRIMLNEAALHARRPDPDADHPAIVELLHRIDSVEMKKGHLLDGVDFANLSIGAPIYVYGYSEKGFENVCFIYPLFEDGEMVTTIKLANIHEICFVPDTYTSNCLSEYVSCNIALVYDDDYLNVYDGTEFYPLYEYADADRSSLEAAEDISALTAELVLNEVAPVAVLEYEP